MQFLYDCGAHFIGGASVAGLDRLFSRNASRFTQERLKDKHDEAVALDYLVSHDIETDGSTSQYRDAVLKSREYFERTGKYSPKKSLVAKVVDNFNSLRTSKANERVNNLPSGKKLAFSYSIELVGDLGVFVSSLTTGIGDGVVAVAETAYQGFAFFLGLQTGKAFLYLKDKCRSKQEKELDEIEIELTKDGKLLDIVRNYSQTAKLENVIKTETSDDTNIQSDEDDSKPKADYGKVVGEKVADVLESAGNTFSSAINAIKIRTEERKKAEKDEEERRRAELREKYDKY